MFFLYTNPIFFPAVDLVFCLVFASVFLFTAYSAIYLASFLSSLLNLAYITIQVSCPTLKFIFNDN